MKHKFLAILLLLALAVPVQAQTTIYFPVILKGAPMDTEAWRLIIPEYTRNMTLNPSAEGTTGYAGGGGAVVTRPTTYAKYGLRSYHVVTGSDGDDLELTLSTLTNAAHYVTLRVRGQLPEHWALALGPNFRTPLKLEQLDNDWAIWGAAFPATEAAGSVLLRVLQRHEGSGDFYADGIQTEAKAGYWTSYTDGDQEDCEWLGAAHASVSQRDAETRAGGRVVDLSYYGFVAETHEGTGTPQPKLNVQTYALLPGGTVSSVQTQPRRFVITGTLWADDEKQLYARREALALALSPAAYDGQPVRLRFAAAATQKQVTATYEGGLEGSLDVYTGNLKREVRSNEWQETSVWAEGVALQFLAGDPFFYEVGESAAELDTSDTLTMRYIVGRLRSTGQWDDLGLTANPVANGAIDTVVRGPDGRIYVGGNFQGLNGTVGANSIDYVGVYDPVEDTWAQVGNAGDFNGEVLHLLFSPAGDLYAAGVFTNVAGNGNADYVARFTAGAWTNVGIPVQGAAAITGAYYMAFDSSGNLYIGGSFLNWANVANADYFVKWDGVNYTAVGAGGTGWIQSIALDSNDNIFIGGAFLNWAADPNADNLAWWDGSSWAAVGDTPLSAQVYTLLMTPENVLFIGGDFSNVAGNSNSDYVVGWNGQAFFNLGTGLNGSCVFLSYLNGILYAGGDFTRAGDITDLADRIARWNGSAWGHLDVDFPATPNPVLVMAAFNPSKVILKNFDIFVSINTTGNGDRAGLTAVENEGTAPVYPTFYVTRAGGTSAVLESLRNERTGEELWLNRAMEDGELVTIDLTPGSKSISTTGNVKTPWSIVLAASDFGSWRLEPGTNDVTCFVNNTGATVTGWLKWKDTFLSLD